MLRVEALSFTARDARIQVAKHLRYTVGLEKFGEHLLRFDFSVYDPNERLVAVFEAKAKPGTDAGWAAKYRRNLLARLGPVAARFFGVVTPDRLYLWSGHGSNLDEVEPDFVMNLSDEFNRLLGGQKTATSSPLAFELLVSSWLNRIIDAETDGHDPLSSAGLRDAVRGGHLAVQAAA